MNQNINQQDVEQLIQLLQLAQSSSNQQQQQVYATLHQLEQNPISYVYLAILFNNSTLPTQTRLMAGLTLKSALQRNHKIIVFDQAQLSQIKHCIMAEEHPELQKPKHIIISYLISLDSFDYTLFDYLINSLPSHPQNAVILNYVLQDIKANSENNNVFADKTFANSTRNIYTQILSIFSSINKADLATNQHLDQFMKLMNALIFHCPSSLYHLVQEYLQRIVKTILTLSQQEQVNSKLALLAMEGYREMISTKATLSIPELTDIIITYRYNQGNTQDMKKCWTNILIELFDNDDQQRLRSRFSDIFPRCIENLNFTEEDQKNIKQEIRIEYNPYSEETGQQQQEYQDQSGEKGFSGDTLRRLTFILIRKIAIQYPEELWTMWGTDILLAIRNTNEPSQTQAAISFVGIIAQTCVDTLAPSLEEIITILVNYAASASFLLRATSLWTLQKLLPQFQQNQAVVSQCINIISKGFDSTIGHSVNVHLMMYHEAGISFIDTALQQEHALQLIKNDTTLLRTIGKVLVQGLTLVTGRSQISVFKAISTIFEMKSCDSPQKNEIYEYILKGLNHTWSSNLQKDSVLCPLFQCLISAYENNEPLLRNYTPSYLIAVIPLLCQQHRTALILRCIDLLSSIVNRSQPQPSLQSPQFQQTLYSLIFAEEKQVIHFAYGLISDYCKKYDLRACIHKFIQAVANSIDDLMLISLSNGLTCLTDLLIKYPAEGQQYVPDVIQKVLSILRSKRMEPIIAFNFARLYGRLSLLNPSLSKQCLMQDHRAIKSICLSLRTRQVVPITSDAFGGLIATFQLLNQAECVSLEEHWACVLDAMICYPIRDDPTPVNNEILQVFVGWVQQLYRQLGQQIWSRIMQEPIFLPGTIKTLRMWVVHQ